MFGFGRKPARSAPAATPHGYVAQTVLVAAPDYATLNRLGALHDSIANQLNGNNGSVVGHDYGAPERTLTGPVRGVEGHTPAVSIGAVKGLPGSVQLPQQEYTDAAGSNAAVDPRAAMLWDRMNQA